ncbi:hypothetical protein JCM24511_00174 [Saitozyma sp. JCM 24511]|nr:hypothetical protein JCM24511_00174 [Saitozyma sp. JCM 24511]
MTSQQPIIVVFGATGYQGGSVVNRLLSTSRHQYHLRAVTRNPQSSAARKLAEKGVEVVYGDANKPESLSAAFDGAWGAFLVTNFWDPNQGLDPETDFVQGKNLVDAAVHSGTVKFVVWSSLHDIDKASGGTLSVPHYTNKYRVEEYIRAQPGLQAAFVYAGFYAQNWVNFPPFGVPTVKEDKVVLETAVRADVALPLIDIEEDFGKFVAPLFADPARFNGLDILAATEYLTVPQMVHIYERLSGTQVHLKRIDVSTVPVPELQATINLFNRYGYYVGELIEPSLALYPSEAFGSFESWLKRVGFKPHQS